MTGRGFAAPPFSGLVLGLESPSSRRRRRGASRDRCSLPRPLATSQRAPAEKVTSVRLATDRSNMRRTQPRANPRMRPSPRKAAVKQGEESAQEINEHLEQLLLRHLDRQRRGLPVRRAPAREANGAVIRHGGHAPLDALFEEVEFEGLPRFKLTDRFGHLLDDDGEVGHYIHWPRRLAEASDLEPQRRVACEHLARIADDRDDVVEFGIVVLLRRRWTEPRLS